MGDLCVFYWFLLLGWLIYCLLFFLDLFYVVMYWFLWLLYDLFHIFLRRFFSGQKWIFDVLLFLKCIFVIKYIFCRVEFLFLRSSMFRLWIVIFFLLLLKCIIILLNCVFFNKIFVYIFFFLNTIFGLLSFLKVLILILWCFNCLFYVLLIFLLL